MERIVNSLNKLSSLGNKTKKYLPFFIGFKLLTFTGFLAFIMNRQMILPSPQFAIDLLIISIGVLVTFDIRFDTLKDKK